MVHHTPGVIVHHTPGVIVLHAGCDRPCACITYPRSCMHYINIPFLADGPQETQQEKKSGAPPRYATRRWDHPTSNGTIGQAGQAHLIPFVRHVPGRCEHGAGVVGAREKSEGKRKRRKSGDAGRSSSPPHACDSGRGPRPTPGTLVHHGSAHRKSTSCSPLLSL